MLHRSIAVAAIICIGIGAVNMANAAEIKVLSANGAKLILTALVPEFERASNNKVTIAYGEAGILRKRIQDGEAFDVTILPAGWDELHGKLAGEPVAIGHTDLGMAVLATAPKPDMSSSEALKRLLLAVKSIVYTDPKTGGISSVLFARGRTARHCR
jgi:molybdate transport system substrate-binding protein